MISVSGYKLDLYEMSTSKKKDCHTVYCSSLKFEIVQRKKSKFNTLWKVEDKDQMLSPFPSHRLD